VVGANDVEVGIPIDAVDGGVSVDLPDLPSVDIGTDQHAPMPNGPVQLGTDVVAALEVVPGVEDHRVTGRVLRPLEKGPEMGRGTQSVRLVTTTTRGYAWRCGGAMGLEGPRRYRTGRLPSDAVWAQAGPTIINEGPGWWATLVASALPAFAAVAAVGLQAHRQRDAEHDRFLVTERFRSYAALLSAMDDVTGAGVAAAEWAASPQRDERSIEHMTELLDQLGSGSLARLVDAPEVERWHEAKSSLRRATLDTMLRASNPCRDPLYGVLSFVDDELPSPIGDPDRWLMRSAPGRVSAPTRVENLRIMVEHMARQEAQIAPPRWRWRLRRLAHH